MKTVAATVASSVDYELYDAYIFRDENVITSQKNGYRYDILADGEMAGIGTEYARVYADGQSADLVTGDAGNDRSSTGSGSASLACGNENHIGTGKGLAEQVDVRDGTLVWLGRQPIRFRIPSEK